MAENGQNQTQRLVMMPIPRPSGIGHQVNQQTLGLVDRIQQGVRDPQVLNQAVRNIGSFFNNATQPAQDLGAWATGPIRQRLANPFQWNEAVRNRAQMPGQRARVIGR